MHRYAIILKIFTNVGCSARIPLLWVSICYYGFGLRAQTGKDFACWSRRALQGLH